MNITLELKKIALAASIALLAAPAFAQTTATTDPVGFITLNVTAGSVGSPAYAHLGLGLTRSVSYQGSAETSTGAQTTIVDNEAVWVDNQFNGAAGAFYVEITSGPGAGTTYDIAGTAGATKTLTLAQPLAASIVNGASFKVRQHWTIGSVFGPLNESGLQGGALATADQILIWNGTGFDTYYYKTVGLGGTGWRSSTSTSIDKQSQIIYPEDGLVLKRIPQTQVDIVLMGAVKTGVSSYPVVLGYNYLANVCAAPMTLASSGLFTSDPNTGVVGGALGTADQVLIWNGTGYSTYYYKTVGLGGTGWRSSSSTSADASSVSIPVGSTVVVNRKNGTAFNWVIPQHPSSL
jgi:uncharacterized protein (TIGR02597 family)